MRPLAAITNLVAILDSWNQRGQRTISLSFARFCDMPHTLRYRPILIDTLISNERIQS